MDNPQGRIQSLVNAADGMRAIVGVDVAAACPRCAAGKGCGAGLVGAADRQRQVEASIPAELKVSEGDLVELALPPDNLLRAALIVYGLPLTGAVAGAALAYGFGYGDAGTALAALGGLAAGVGTGRVRLRREACLRRFVPTIAKRLSGSQAGS